MRAKEITIDGGSQSAKLRKILDEPVNLVSVFDELGGEPGCARGDVSRET